MIWSPLLAVSRQAEEAVGRTTADVEGGAGWVTGEPVAGALVGSPPARADPRAKPRRLGRPRLPPVARIPGVPASRGTAGALRPGVLIHPDPSA
jgi:hypothetical protein